MNSPILWNACWESGGTRLEFGEAVALATKLMVWLSRVSSPARLRDPEPATAGSHPDANVPRPCLNRFGLTWPRWDDVERCSSSVSVIRQAAGSSVSLSYGCSVVEPRAQALFVGLPSRISVFGCIQHASVFRRSCVL